MPIEEAEPFLEVDKPEPITIEDVRDPDSEDGVSDEAKERYDQAYRYATRQFLEAGDEHEEIADAAVAFVNAEPDETAERREAFRYALQEHDPDRWAEVQSLGLSMFQGSSAENTAAVLLEADRGDEEGDE